MDLLPHPPGRSLRAARAALQGPIPGNLVRRSGARRAAGRARPGERDQVGGVVRAHEGVVGGLLGTVRCAAARRQPLGERRLVQDQRGLHEAGGTVRGELLELLEERSACEELPEDDIVPVGEVPPDHRDGEPTRLEARRCEVTSQPPRSA